MKGRRKELSLITYYTPLIIANYSIKCLLSSPRYRKQYPQSRRSHSVLAGIENDTHCTNRSPLHPRYRKRYPLHKYEFPLSQVSKTIPINREVATQFSQVSKTIPTAQIGAPSIPGIEHDTHQSRGSRPVLLGIENDSQERRWCSLSFFAIKKCGNRKTFTIFV